MQQNPYIWGAVSAYMKINYYYSSLRNKEFSNFEKCTNLNSDSDINLRSNDLKKSIKINI